MYTDNKTKVRVEIIVIPRRKRVNALNKRALTNNNKSKKWRKLREQLERNDGVQLDEEEVTNRQGRGREEKGNPECGLFLGLSTE